MRVAYVDTSCLVAIAFGEPGAEALTQKLEAFELRIAANLVEAELRSAFRREEVTFAPEMLAGITWVLPDRPLSRELARVLEAGYARGADLWHLAMALYVVGDSSDLTFATLDDRQAGTAAALGFARLEAAKG